MPTRDRALYELFPSTCHWPTAIDEDGVQLFCGAPVAIHLDSRTTRGSYCAAHGALAVRAALVAASRKDADRSAAAPAGPATKIGRLKMLCDEMNFSDSP